MKAVFKGIFCTTITHRHTLIRAQSDLFAPGKLKGTSDLVTMDGRMCASSPGLAVFSKHSQKEMEQVSPLIRRRPVLQRNTLPM